MWRRVQRMGHAKEGIAKCTQAITVQPSLAKAFYRRWVLGSGLGIRSLGFRGLGLGVEG